MDAKICKLKKELKNIIIEEGGSTTVRKLAVLYSKKYKKFVNIKEFHCQTFTQLLNNFSDMFEVFLLQKDLCVKMLTEVREQTTTKDTGSQTDVETFERGSQTLEPALSNESLKLKQVLASSTPVSSVYGDEICEVEYSRYTNSSGSSIHSDKEECENALDDSDSASKSDLLKRFLSDAWKKKDDTDNIIENDVSSNTLEALSGISDSDEEFNKMVFQFGDSDAEDNDINIKVLSLEEILALTPFDDPMFYSKYEPINRNPFLTLDKMIMATDFKDNHIYISDIFSPIHFWFQPSLDDGGFSNYSEMSNSLDSEYKRLSKKDLRIHEKNFSPGLIVACFVAEFNRWHRGEIIKVCENKKRVRIFFLDYGSIGNMPKKDVRYLYQKFLRYPAFCERGRLHGVKPPKGRKLFNEKEIIGFIDFVTKAKKIKANVAKYNEEESCFELDIYSDNECLKEYVLNNRYAEEARPGEILTICDYPNFDLLESTYPAFHETKFN